MFPFIEMKNVSFEYKLNGSESLMAVNDVSLTVNKGSHVAILGRNGSGKSTLARLINGLEIPFTGSISVAGLVHDSEKSSLEIRRKCGIVFQNPDNQIIGTTVEEDVAFGPENLGIPREEMILQIDKALEAVGLMDKKKTAPHLLSGGQKQKLAIAGILAMSPECFILDEATSMLDPRTRKEFISLITELVIQRDMTIINITHDMEEAVLADYVYIMDEGSIVSQGPPAEIFEKIDLLRSHGLDVPVHIEIVDNISKLTRVDKIPQAAFSTNGAAKEIIRMCKETKRNLETIEKEISSIFSLPIYSKTQNPKNNIILEVNDLSYTYARETVFASDALKNINMHVFEGEIFGIVGQTGSGKSTLVQHFNGLIRPQTGNVIVMGNDTSKKADINEIRKHAGLLFQYPEHQLFEESVFKDVAFGPKCLGMNEEEIQTVVPWALDIVGLGEDFYAKSPFELSGGQKRRVAIAGIVAMKPDILILDEPAVGLDPAGRDEILSFVKQLSDAGATVILVSHNMDDIAKLANRVLVLKEGEVSICASPEELFDDSKDIGLHGISFPVITAFMKLMRSFIPKLSVGHFTTEECSVDIVRTMLSERGDS